MSELKSNWFLVFITVVEPWQAFNYISKPSTFLPSPVLFVVGWCFFFFFSQSALRLFPQTLRLCDLCEKACVPAQLATNIQICTSHASGSESGQVLSALKPSLQWTKTHYDRIAWHASKHSKRIVVVDSYNRQHIFSPPSKKHTIKYAVYELCVFFLTWHRELLWLTKKDFGSGLGCWWHNVSVAGVSNSFWYGGSRCQVGLTSTIIT